MQPGSRRQVGSAVSVRFIVVINKQAGAVALAADGFSPEALAGEFAAVGVRAETRFVAPGEVEAAVRAALAERPQAIVVGGGDGTVRSAAALVAGGELALGVLPLGTLNHFAKDLGIPLGWREAVAALAWGVVREVDVGEVNGRVFVNNCSLGAYAAAVRRRDALRREHGHGKWRAMARAWWEVLRNLRRLRLRVTAAGVVREERTPLLVVANNRYSGPVLGESLRGRLDEGRLWLYSTRARGWWAKVRLVWQALTRRRPDEADDLYSEAAAEFMIASDRGPTPVAADGEAIEVTFGLAFRVRPKALRVLAPPEKGGGR